MTCETCSQIRMAYVDAMIALDVKRMAELTVQAVKHIVAPKPEPPDGP